MAEDYLYVKVVAPILAACASFGAAVMAFRPRLLRAEKDIRDLEKDKLNKETFLEVKSHIDTKFEVQGREIGEIKIGVHKLLERRGKSRE